MKSLGKKKCWSPVPKESYAILYEGETMSVSEAAGLDLPGAWNILYLCLHEALDALLQYDGDPGDFPVNFSVTPAVVGTSLQIVGGKTLGEWAEELTPAEWIKKARGTETLLEAAYPGVFNAITVPEQKRKPGELIKVEFGRR